MKEYRVEVSDLQKVTSTTVQMLHIASMRENEPTYKTISLDDYRRDSPDKGMVELLFSADKVRSRFDQTKEVVDFFKINDVESTAFEIHIISEKDSSEFVTCFLKPKNN